MHELFYIFFGRKCFLLERTFNVNYTFISFCVYHYRRLFLFKSDFFTFQPANGGSISSNLHSSDNILQFKKNENKVIKLTFYQPLEIFIAFFRVLDTLTAAFAFEALTTNKNRPLQIYKKIESTKSKS